MCKKSTLYEAGVTAAVQLQKRPRGGKLNFKQVSYTTDCVREFANVREIPMFVALQQLQSADAMGSIYRSARSASPVAAKTLARTMAAQIMV